MRHTLHFFDDFFFFGTLAPALRAFDKPIAIACLRLFTFLPDRPLLSVPFFRSCIVFLTFCEAFLPYLAMRAPCERPAIICPGPKLHRAKSRCCDKRFALD